MPPEAHAIDSQTIASGVATGNVSPTGTHNWSTQYLPQFGNKTVGSNLWTAMADNSSYPFETRPSGGLNGAWNNTSGYGLAYVAVTLTEGKLYRIRFDASSVSGVASYIGTASNSAATNWKNKVLITAGTNLTGVFRADSQTLMIVMHTANGAAAFTLANMTLYEVEEPNLQAEVAKSYIWREFGNGAANLGPTGAWADATMLENTGDNIAYVMDDGLTSLSGNTVFDNNTADLYTQTPGTSKYYFTFIGTGLSVRAPSSTSSFAPIAQNLPYGTHVLEVFRDSSATPIKLDGVEISASYTNLHSIYEISFHQPKKPPIPEDAVVLADYMLMADFVVQSAGTVGHISKGVRSVSATRDFFYDGASLSSNLAVSMTASISYGLKATSPNLSASDDTATYKLPYFGTDFVVHHYANRTGTLTENLNSDAGTATAISTSAFEGHTKHIGNALALNEIKNHHANGVNDAEMWTQGCQIASPIHTSHHYQPFESQYLDELVGGDRNMEQHNLVCSADGKTWDQITRDTSYIGKSGFSLSTEISHGAGHTGFMVFSSARGGVDGVSRVDAFGGGAGSNKYKSFYTKDFTLGHTRIICLRDGLYKISTGAHTSSGVHMYLYVNGVIVEALHRTAASGGSAISGDMLVHLKRGDYIQRKGGYDNDNDNWWGRMMCHRVE